MKVAFFLLHYPVFSETFVSKEILNLQNLGVDGLIVCEKQNHSPPFHPHIQEIKFPINEISTKIFGSQFLPIISAHFYWLSKNPLGYLRSIQLLFSFFNFHHFRVFIKAPLLAKKMKIENIDLIYVHEVDSPSLFGLICSKLCQIPCGIIMHTQYLFAQNKFLKEKIKQANFIIFQSKYSQKVAGNPLNSFVISTPGIDTDFFQPPTKMVYHQQIRLLSIGRLEEAKGYPILLKAIPLIRKNYPHILLTIVGDGSQKQLLQTYINNNNLQKNVHLLGFISHNQELLNVIHQHQYFILPSIIDSRKVHDVHPNVVKEAMACGLITITSNLGGIDEIIKDKQNGFLIDTVSPKNIVKIIKFVHLLPISQKIIISSQARITILKNHQQENLCHQLKQIFSDYTHEK